VGLIGTALLTLLPAVRFSGLVGPEFSLQDVGQLIGEFFPTNHFFMLARMT
jgi:ribosome-dependent ATPase